MEEELEEVFISGFCRTCNQMQTVTCEYYVENGKKQLQMMNCAHEKCSHHGSCEIYKQARRG